MLSNNAMEMYSILIWGRCSEAKLIRLNAKTSVEVTTGDVRDETYSVKLREFYGR